MSEKTKTIWKNRIVGIGEKPAKDFVFNPLNWRTHPEFQRQTLNAILEEVGFVTGVIENITTGNLIDGHARIEEALAKDPETLVPFIQVELTEEEERKVLAVLDQIGAMATTDNDRLRELSELLNFKSDSLTELMRLKSVEEINLNEFFAAKPDERLPEKFVIELEFTERELHDRVLEKFGELAKTPSEAVIKILSL